MSIDEGVHFFWSSGNKGQTHHHRKSRAAQSGKAGLEPLVSHSDLPFVFTSFFNTAKI